LFDLCHLPASASSLFTDILRRLQANVNLSLKLKVNAIRIQTVGSETVHYASVRRHTNPRVACMT